MCVVQYSFLSTSTVELRVTTSQLLIVFGIVDLGAKDLFLLSQSIDVFLQLRSVVAFQVTGLNLTYGVP